MSSSKALSARTPRATRSHLSELPPEVVHQLAELFRSHEREEFAQDIERLEELAIRLGECDGALCTADFTALFFLRILRRVLTMPGEEGEHLHN